MSVFPASGGSSSKATELQIFPVTIELLNYKWSLSRQINTDSDSVTIVVEVSFASRYTFPDKVFLEIDVLDQTLIIQQNFELKKTSYLQLYEIQMSKKSHAVNIDNLQVQANVKISSISYYAKDFGAVGYFTNPRRPHKVVVSIGKEAFYMNKSYLATWSRYFEQLFTEDPTIQCVDLKDVSEIDFQSLLEIISVDIDAKVDDSNYLAMLNLASRLEIPTVLIMCEPFLLEYNEKVSFAARKANYNPNSKSNCYLFSNDVQVHALFDSTDALLTKLILADRYNLPNLQISCIYRYKILMSESEGDAFLEENEGNLQEISLEMKKNLFSYPTKDLLDYPWLKRNGILDLVPTLKAPKLTDPKRKHDVIFDVEDTQFYLNKGYLAAWSRYFECLFLGDFKEKTEPEVVLKDIDAVQFETLLILIHPGKATDIDDSNVVYLLKLADRFEISSVIVMCGTHLVKNVNEDNLMDLLELSDQYNISHLQVECLKLLHEKNGNDFKNFLDVNRSRIKELSKNTLIDIV